MSTIDLPDQVVAEFRACLEAARAAQTQEPTAMTLATSDNEGRISARVVLLKEMDARGFVFYTNLDSDKARQLQAVPRAALTFFWAPVARQVRVEGVAEPVSTTEADAYFASRPRGSQIGAWASRQSRPLSGREVLEAEVERVESEYRDRPVPRPPHWSGFRVRPDRVEFWYGREYRLHDRFRWALEGDRWRCQRLFP